LAVFDLAEAYVPRALLSLKWPNDLLIGGAKASGILVESGPALGGLWLAVGVGVNLRSHPEDLDRPATSFAAHLRGDAGAPPLPESALARLAHSFNAWCIRWERDGFEPIRAAWTERTDSLGRPATARLGHETVHGLAEGLESDGALRLRLPDGSARRITAGDVFTG
jgi:BirA family biotin operon repressor/biotin-[acetyl-CoA-carboxylase] ligase